MASKTRGGVRSYILTGGAERKPATALSNDTVSVWANTQNHAITVDVRARGEKGADDLVTIEVANRQIEHDRDGVMQRLFHGTFEELIAKLNS